MKKAPFQTSLDCGRAHYSLTEDGAIAVTNKMLVEEGYKVANGIAQCSTEGVGHCNIAFSKF